MRELKFRIWDNKLKIFLPLDYIWKEDYSSPPPAPLISIDGRLWYWSSQHWGRDNELVTNTENYIINQFTGLKDSENTDIYEGDILGYYNNGVLGEKVEVYYDNDFAAFRLRAKSFNGYLSHKQLSNVKIIGNIYEGH